MLWLYLLGAVTALVIALRRVLRRQKPLDDEIFKTRVAFDHVHSGVAWVRADGTIASANPAFLATLETTPEKLLGSRWESIFPANERTRIDEAYRSALLQGKVDLDTLVERADGSSAHVRLSLVVVHDHKMRFVGHHCLMDDRTRELELEAQLQELSTALGMPQKPVSGRPELLRATLQVISH